MKIKITKIVKDLQTGEDHKPGDVIERTEERANQFISKGYAEAVVEEIEVISETVKPRKRRKKKA